MRPVGARDSGGRPARLDLKALLSLGSGLLISTLVAILSLAMQPAATRQIEVQIGGELQELAFQMHDKLSRGLSERLHDISLAASLDAFADPSASSHTKEALLHWLRYIYPEYSWLGLLGPNGEVIAHTAGAGAPADLAHEAWFRGGLEGPYLDTVPRSLDSRSVKGDGPDRFVDLAVPVVNEDDVVGVLGAHLSWAWAEDAERTLLAPLRQRRGAELFVVSADGVVVLGPPELAGKQLDVPSVREARAGHTGYTVAFWPDGKEYVTGFTAGPRGTQPPASNWLVLARQDAALAFAPAVDLQRRLLVYGAATALGFMLLAWFGAGWLATPLKELSAAADQLERGTGGGRLLPTSDRYAEVASLTSSLSALLERLRQNELRLRTLALHDSLTGLPNRVLLRERLRQAISSSRRNSRAAALLILDLDHFKDVNDTLGHPIGDRLLAEAARRLSTCVREMDTIARLGGDEFALLLLDMKHASDVSAVARKVVSEVTRAFHIDGEHVFVGASVGIAVCGADGTDPDELLRHADLALYSAKAAGRRTCHFFAPAMAANVAARKELERDLRDAFEAGRLELHFQPELNLRLGTLRGAEALLRWKKGGHTWVSPSKFVPVAEESGLIGSIGSWVLDKACQQAKAWRASGLPAFKVAVNVSPIQCRRDLSATVEKALRLVDLSPEAIELEVTESVFFREDDDRVAEQLARLRAIGVSVAIDDFGTGYSSLSRLRALPVDKIKIDRSFIARLGCEAGADTIVRAMVELGHGLGLLVTAEGVENQAQLHCLRAAGCDSVQGFLIGRPVEARELGLSNVSRMIPAA